jgi:hypothetical protein
MGESTVTDQAERLMQARAQAGYISPTEAARAFGWKEATYYAHENASRGLTRTTAERYARAFRVSASWLLLGAGPPDIKSNGEPLLFDHSMLIQAIESLLTTLLPDMDTQQANALAEAVLRLVELQQRRIGTVDDNLRAAVAATAKLAVIPESK